MIAIKHVSLATCRVSGIVEEFELEHVQAKGQGEGREGEGREGGVHLSAGSQAEGGQDLRDEHFLSMVTSEVTSISHKSIKKGNYRHIWRREGERGIMATDHGITMSRLLV